MNRSLMRRVNRMIRATFDWKHHTAKHQPKSNWDKFWEKIPRIDPTLLDPDMEPAIVNQVRNHIRMTRCTHRHELQREKSTTILHTHFSPDIKLRNATIVIWDKDLPKFRRPATCLIPLALPTEPQMYEISIIPAIPTPSQATSWNQCVATHQPSTPWGQVHPSSPIPFAGAAPQFARSHQKRILYRLPSLEVQTWESPDVHRFLSGCVPPMTHLLSKFVNDLEIKDLKCLWTLKRWPAQTLRKYFLNLTRRRRLTGIEAEVIMKGLEEL